MNCDIECYRINYNEDDWRRIAKRHGSDMVMPVGAATAIRCLCNEVEHLRAKIKSLNSRLAAIRPAPDAENRAAEGEGGSCD